LLGTSAGSFGNGNSLSVVVALVPVLLGEVTQPNGANPTQSTRSMVNLLQEGYFFIAKDKLDFASAPFL
jgi:hypothetical protein